MNPELESLTARRIVIVGGPRTGKTSLAFELGAKLGISNIRHTDELAERFDWSGASEEASHWFDAEGDWIVEGVAVPRALRKWLARNPERQLEATAILLRRPRETQTTGQVAMSKGVATVWGGIVDQLLVRGVAVVSGDSLSA